MGLDSVELVMEIEKYFGIHIKDAEAEKMYTVQDAVDTVAEHLHIQSIDTTIRDSVFSKVKQSIQQLTTITKEIQLTDKVSDYLPVGDKEHWKKFESFLELKVPRPDKYDPKSTSFINIFKGITGAIPTYAWQLIQFDQFTDAVSANNYKALLDPRNINSKHEIYIAIAGITADKMGIDNYEILPAKSFTTDLGID